MGSELPQGNFRASPQPVHDVSVKPFALGRYPVTRGQWRRVAQLPQVSTDLLTLPRLNMPLEEENQLPVDVVSIARAEEYCRRVSRFTGRDYRLPSEAEWEYACRAGTTTSYHFGNTPSLALVNYHPRPLPPRLTPVGSKEAPNRFGLHDMHGNVLEWSADPMHPDYLGAPSDGSVWGGGDSSYRMVRGGDFLSLPVFTSSFAREYSSVNVTASGVGFRVAMDIAVDFFDPRFTAAGMVDAAQFSTSPVSPGAIVSIFGQSIGPDTPLGTQLNDDGMVSTSLGSVQVSFDGIPAPLLYASRSHINAVVPIGIAGKEEVEVIVKHQGQTSEPVIVAAQDASPTIFTLDGSGTGPGVILNEDYSVNSASNPAPRGSVVMIYATGTGLTTQPLPDGAVSQAADRTVLPVHVSIGGVDAVVEYSGCAPGIVYGVTQVNVRIPAECIPGPATLLSIAAGGRSNPAGVTLAVSE